MGREEEVRRWEVADAAEGARFRGWTWVLLRVALLVMRYAGCLAVVLVLVAVFVVVDVAAVVAAFLDLVTLVVTSVVVSAVPVGLSVGASAGADAVLPERRTRSEGPTTGLRLGAIRTTCSVNEGLLYLVDDICMYVYVRPNPSLSQ